MDRISKQRHLSRNAEWEAFYDMDGPSRWCFDALKQLLDLWFLVSKMTYNLLLCDVLHPFPFVGCAFPIRNGQETDKIDESALED